MGITNFDIHQPKAEASLRSAKTSAGRKNKNNILLRELISNRLGKIKMETKHLGAFRSISSTLVFVASLEGCWPE